MRRHLSTALMFLSVISAAQSSGCFLIGGAIGGAFDGPPTYDTIAVSQLPAVEEGTMVKITKKDQSHIEGLFIRMDTTSVSDVYLMVLAKEGGSPSWVPIDSVNGVSIEYEAHTGKTIGTVVGAALDVTFVVLIVVSDGFSLPQGGTLSF